MRYFLYGLTSIFLFLVVASNGFGGIPDQPWFPKAPSLPKPSGNVIQVKTVNELFQAAKDVAPGGAILLADGHYLMPRYFEITTDNVTLRSASGDRHKVILDGASSRHGELVGITGAKGVTVADLTIRNVKWNGFQDQFGSRRGKGDDLQLRHPQRLATWRQSPGHAEGERDSGTSRMSHSILPVLQ